MISFFYKYSPIKNKKFTFHSFECCSCWGFQQIECITINIVEWSQPAFLF